MKYTTKSSVGVNMQHWIWLIIIKIVAIIIRIALKWAIAKPIREL